MQTFLAYPDFSSSMRVLDPARLGNQVYREGVILLRGGWSHHPAARMWRNYRRALAAYLWEGVLELLRRGRDYRCRPWASEILRAFMAANNAVWETPPWLGDPNLHASHRSNLLRKDPQWYGQFGWREPSDLPYVWPVRKEVA